MLGVVQHVALSLQLHSLRPDTGERTDHRLGVLFLPGDHGKDAS
jgi:hypothetical protein